ncbi:UTRA domain-containing protein [Actinoplanes sp. NPDC026619]|uniref:UTRA domain-containing protein n=1 Tax=Actinoplanes sp. NPDC026619 TaxID=3155798 RepID=UPI0033CE1FB9
MSSAEVEHWLDVDRFEDCDQDRLPIVTRLNPWIAARARTGRSGSSDLVSVHETPAPAQVAAACGIEKGTPVVARHQLLRLDDEPAELVGTYYPTEIARGSALAEMKKIKGRLSLAYRAERR